MELFSIMCFNGLRLPSLLESQKGALKRRPVSCHDPVVPRDIRVEPPISPRDQFCRDGFVVIDSLLGRGDVDKLNARLEDVMSGRYSTGKAPDKFPKVAGGKLLNPSKRTIQIINIWKADVSFAALVKSPKLGKLVAELGGWPGARVANDQVWAKPPLAGPLSFHRDSAYFDFVPSDVITVWIALDDMLPEMGPLEYVVGSHMWGDGRFGSANQFFDKDSKSLLFDAAKREGIVDPEQHLTFSTVDVKAGGAAIHNGRTWHGSGPNSNSKRPRRGLGIHFIPASATFRPGVPPTQMWAKHKKEGSDLLPDEELPITFES
jgi:phytanoyl-CoA hydroxylase